MPDKTVLVIAYYFPPMGLSGVQRTLKFVKYLPEYGWNVIVLTSGNDKYYAFDESQLRELDTNNVKIFRTDQPKPDLAKLTKKFPGTIKQKFGRLALNSIYIPDSKIKWKDSAVKAGNSIMKKYDIDTIFATAPPFTDFLVASELAAKFQKPFIIDYRDSWVDNDFHYYPTFFHKNASIKLETKILNRAKRAIVTTR